MSHQVYVIETLDAVYVGMTGGPVKWRCNMHRWGGRPDVKQLFKQLHSVRASRPMIKERAARLEILLMKRFSQDGKRRLLNGPNTYKNVKGKTK